MPVIRMVLYHCYWQDVMVVGEPTLMGGEFGDKDERLIARLENTQYDPTDQQDSGLLVTGSSAGGPETEHQLHLPPGSSYGPPSLGGVGGLQSRVQPRLCGPGSPTQAGTWGQQQQHANNIDDKLEFD